MIQTSIYDKVIYFAIIYEGVKTEVLEPDKWNQISERIPRDKTWYGFWSDFIEDKYGVTFSFIKSQGLTGGGEILRSIYDTRGAEAEVLFEFGEKRGNTLIPINSWSINLNTYYVEAGGDNSIANGVRVSIEKMPFQAKLRSRFGSICTVNDYANMDGELLDPISTWNLRMHSKVIPEESRCITAGPIDSDEYLDPDNNRWTSIVNADLTNHVIDELKQVFTQPMGLVNTTKSYSHSTEGIPFTLYNSQFNSFANGSTKIRFSGSCKIWWSIIYEDSGHILHNWCLDPNYGFIIPRIVVQRFIGGVWTIFQIANGTNFNFHASSYTSCLGSPQILTRNTYSTGGSGTLGRDKVGFSEYSWDETFDLELLSDDKVYIQLAMEMSEVEPLGFLDYTLNDYQIADYINDVTINQFTWLPSSQAPAFRIFDVISQSLECITGQKNALISNFFSEGGFGYKYLLANGYGIRNFSDNPYKFKKDLQSLLADLQAIFCLGIGVTKIGEVEYLRVEKLTDLFQEKTIATFTDTFDWVEQHNPDFCFNSANLGYNKFEGLNIVQQDEFNTSGNYLLQFLKIHQNLLDKKSNIIASGYLIEEQRRNQFVLNHGQNLTNDNDIFIIATAEPCLWRNNQFQIVEELGLPYIKFLFDMSMLAGDVLSIDMSSLSGSSSVECQIITRVDGYPKYDFFAGFGPYIIDKYELYLEGVWVTTGTYTAGNIVSYFGILYLCKLGLYSTVAPTYDTAHWVTFYASPNFILDTTIITPSPDQVFSERNQPFEICSNVIDPSTIYNGRLSLKHILYNWRPLLGVGLFGFDYSSESLAVSQIVTTLAKMNSLFTTKFLSTEPFKGNVGDLTLTEISREFVRDYLHAGKSLFTPKGAECKVRIGNNTMNLLRLALTGATGDSSVDFGGIVLKDCFGDLWFCHVMNINYDLVKEIATLQVQKVNRVVA